MDRDAIGGHAIAAFFKESFMERSDGVKMPICISCGTVPIYNPRMNISMCPMCDGPAQYLGDTIHNMELLPPLGRPKANIVQVEMPYATKLLAQEQETFLNMSMRFITTRGVECLRPLERLYPIEELPEVELKAREENTRDKQIPPMEGGVLYDLSPLQLEQLQESIKQLTKGGTVDPDEEFKPDADFENEENSNTSFMGGQDINSGPMMQGSMMQSPMMHSPMMHSPMPQNSMMQGPMIQGPMMQSPMPQNSMMQSPMMQQSYMPVPQPQMQQGGQLSQIQAPIQGFTQQGFTQQGLPSESQDKIISVPSVVGGAPIIAVDTSSDAMERDGIEVGGRPLRRRFQPFMQQPQVAQQGGTQNQVGLLTITKLE